MPGNQSTPGSTNNTSAESSLSSSEVTVCEQSSSLSTPASLEPSPAFFKGVATHVAENIINWLPAHDIGFRAFFRVIAATKADDSYKSVRQGVVNGMQTQFLHDVADAELKSAQAILKLAMVNPAIFEKLLTTRKNIIQKNGLIVTGTALEIALKCWDSSSCEGGQEEMAEMLMRYMRMLPDGEQLIQTAFTKLFPNGKEVHQEDQIKRADEFAQSILEPLAESIRAASDADIQLVYALTAKQANEVDSYIENTLANNSFWKKLMAYHKAIKQFMIKDIVYNPCYLLKAFEIVDKKKEKENWNNLSKGYFRSSLLTLHGVGGIQACSPTIVGMLFARGGIFDYYDMKYDRKKFKVERDCKFVHGSGDVFAQSGGGVLLVSKKFWAASVECRGPGGRARGPAEIWAAVVGIYLSDKNTVTWKPVSEFISVPSTTSQCVMQ